MTPQIRPSTEGDSDALRELDLLTWSWTTQPGPPIPAGAPIFGPGRRPDDTLVALVEGVVVGYIGIRPVHDMESSRHVLEVRGLAVHPAHSGKGIGRALLVAAIAEATRRGARKLSLRVLGGNAAARHLYESAGFIVEGVLREEFFLEGQYVDDIMMAIRLRS